MRNSLFVDHLKIRSNFLDCIQTVLWWYSAEVLASLSSFTSWLVWCATENLMIFHLGSSGRFRIRVQWTTTGRDCEFHLSLRSPQGWIRKWVETLKIKSRVFRRSCPFFAQVRRFRCFRISAVCQRHFASLHVYLHFATGDITFKDLTKLWSTCFICIPENHVEMYPRSFPCQETYGSVWSPEGLLLLVACVNCRSPLSILQPLLITAWRAMLEEVKQDLDNRSCLLLISTWWTRHDRLFTMFAVMGIPVTVGGFFGAVAQMSMVPCFSNKGTLVANSTYLLKSSLSSFWNAST